MSSLEANELEQLLKETEFEYEKDPALEQAFEMSTHDFHIPQSDFHSALQDILRSLIESCLIKGLKFSSNIQADKIFSISYAHEKVLKHLNKPILTPPDEDNRDILETWNNRYHPKPVEVIPPKTKQLLQDIFNKK